MPPLLPNAALLAFILAACLPAAAQGSDKRCKRGEKKLQAVAQFALLGQERSRFNTAPTAATS